jgi:hypothetical protein
VRLGSKEAATAFEAVARAFGEKVRVEPMLSSEYSVGAPDPDRAQKEVRAIVSLSPSTEGFSGARQGSRSISTMTRLASRVARIWLKPEDYAAIGYELRAGDRIVFIERPAEPPHSVAREPVASERGDVVVHLVVEGSI